MNLVVIGLGYVGLPLARAATLHGCSVVGLEIDESRVDSLNRGRSHIGDLPDRAVAEMCAAGFRASLDESVIAAADTVAICVPTPLGEDRTPDLTAVRQAAMATARHLRPGTLVVLESTTYPGTTDEFLRPILESTGLVAGKDFALAFSPERIDPGNPVYGLQNTPKVVGGYTPDCARRCEEFYRLFVAEVLVARGTREAEMTKLLENTYRQVNIALVNEIAQFSGSLDIDIWDVIRCAATKPFGFQAFRPGPGVGGHCIPIDPNYLSYRVATLGHRFRLAELAQEINQNMPDYVAQRVQDLLNDRGLPVRGSRVLLLGVAYKSDVRDQRGSPATPLARRLLALGAEVAYHDPFVLDWSPSAGPVERVEDLAAGLPAADVTVLLQAHSAYDLDYVAKQSRLLFDACGATTGESVVRL